MSDEDIISFWRQGYSIDQITNMSVMVQRTKKDEDARKFVKNRVERVILKYQS